MQSGGAALLLPDSGVVGQSCGALEPPPCLVEIATPIVLSWVGFVKLLGARGAGTRLDLCRLRELSFEWSINK